MGTINTSRSFVKGKSILLAAVILLLSGCSPDAKDQKAGSTQGGSQRREQEYQASTSRQMQKTTNPIDSAVNLKRAKDKLQEDIGEYKESRDQELYDAIK